MARYPSDTVYGDGRAGQRIADHLATAPLRFEKVLAYATEPVALADRRAKAALCRGGLTLDDDACIDPGSRRLERLPGKNTRPLHGKPLIAWTVETAKHARLVRPHRCVDGFA